MKRAVRCARMHVVRKAVCARIHHQASAHGSPAACADPVRCIDAAPAKASDVSALLTTLTRPAGVCGTAAQWPRRVVVPSPSWLSAFQPHAHTVGASAVRARRVVRPRRGLASGQPGCPRSFWVATDRRARRPACGPGRRRRWDARTASATAPRGLPPPPSRPRGPAAPRAGRAARARCGRRPPAAHGCRRPRQQRRRRRRGRARPQARGPGRRRGAAPTGPALPAANLGPSKGSREGRERAVSPGAGSKQAGARAGVVPVVQTSLPPPPPRGPSAAGTATKRRLRLRATWTSSAAVRSASLSGGGRRRGVGRGRAAGMAGSAPQPHSVHAARRAPDAAAAITAVAARRDAVNRVAAWPLARAPRGSVPRGQAPLAGPTRILMHGLVVVSWSNGRSRERARAMRHRRQVYSIACMHVYARRRMYDNGARRLTALRVCGHVRRFTCAAGRSAWPLRAPARGCRR